MSTYTASVVWIRPADAPFTDNRYSRGHEWRFDGGTVVPASSSPQVVPEPLSRPDAVDPEEAFIAALSSCHMLFFLSYAAKAGYVVDRYEDEAVGEMGKNAAGTIAMLVVRLRPAITWEGTPPEPAELERLHSRAHSSCFIAHSVTSDIVVEPAGR